jgi:glycosyltransferase involved in cell wall biosynthesis
MRLLVDVQPLQTASSRTRGIGRYSRNLLAALAAARPGWRVELVQNTRLEPPDLPPLPDLPRHSFAPPFRSRSEKCEANDRYYADWLTARGADAIFILSWFEPLAVVPQFQGPRHPLFSVLYDLIPLLSGGHYLKDRLDVVGYAEFFRLMLQSDCLLAISQATARDLCRLLAPPLPEIVPIAGASDPAFAPHPEAALARFREGLRTKFHLEREFILYVGGMDVRKNLVGALQAFAALPPAVRHGLDLVVACHLPEKERGKLEAVGRGLGIARALKLTGFVTDEELTALYQLCRVFFFPSLYEGLGLPVLEALQCGAPVVASDRSSIPEFAGSVSWLADPGAPADLARALLAALEEPRDARREARIAHARRFRWENCAELACRAIESAFGCQLSAIGQNCLGRQPGADSPLPIADCRQPTADRRRPRIAWVSPLPPAPSGIADHSAELLPHLARHFDIELVVDAGRPLISYEMAREYVVVNSREAAARHHSCRYDLFVYQIGNSPWHLGALDLLWRYRGLLVLHDWNLGGLVHAALRKSAWPAKLDEELEREGEAALAARVRTIPSGDLPEIPARVAMNRRILGAAEAVLVHSAWTWQRVRAAVNVPVARVPLHVAAPRAGDSAAERARLGLPSDGFVISSLGWVNPAKRLESLLRAVAQLPPRLRDRTIVAIVGAALPEEKERLATLAGALRIAGAIRWVGYAPLEELSAYARAADVCVQLRFPAQGETSAALLRALAVGAACVISDQGAMAEVSADAALRVRTPDHEVEDLRAALTHLYEDCGAREELGRAAQRYVREQHSVAAIVQTYATVIHLAALRRRQRDADWVELGADALRGTQLDSAKEQIAPWAAMRRQGQQLMHSGEIGETRPQEGLAQPRRCA